MRVLLVGFAVLALVAGCAADPDKHGESKVPRIPPTKSARPTLASSPPASPTPSPSQSASPTPTEPRASGTVTVRAHTWEKPDPVRLKLGMVLHVVTDQSRQPWQPPTSTNPAVLRCTSRTISSGAQDATCESAALGTVTVTSSAGDAKWQVTVIVGT